MNDNPDVQQPTHPSVDYDPSEVSAPLVVKALIIVATALVLAIVVCGLFYVAMQTPQQKQSVFLSTVQQRTRSLVPPEPRLQSTPGHPISPEQELTQMRRQDDDVLSTYGWVNQQEGIARIPIDEAMRLLVQQGLGAATESEHAQHTPAPAGKEQQQ